MLDDDEDAAVALQHQFKLTPMSVWTGHAVEREDVPAPRPYRDFRTGDRLDFYRMLNWCLAENPPPSQDAGAFGLFERTGVAPGVEFDPSVLHPAMVAGMERAIDQGLASLLGELPFCVPNANGWLIHDPSRSGSFGTDYPLRLVTADHRTRQLTSHQLTGALVPPRGANRQLTTQSPTVFGWRAVDATIGRRSSWAVLGCEFG